MNIELTLESKDYPTSEELLTSVLPVNHVFETIVEYNLRDFNEAGWPESKEAWDILQEIYHKILRQDPVWHFFYEGTFSHLRFSRCFEADVQDILNAKNIKYDRVEVWRDMQGATADYQRIFTYLFHGFSVLAIEVPYEQLPAIFDRIIHCFLNHNWYKAWPYRKEQGELLWEGAYIANNALNRAAYQGYCRGLSKSTKESQTV